ncbi:MAG: sulfur carrier protein ThiS [Chlorobiaceae bacterium]|nr:sulfur carrier protein ThiS [Chlorobiaceae bacterium]NTV60513.1 sulfur carrier protein ThiS [Chlorobiaceae bacterium]
MISIELNGKKQELPPDSSVGDLLAIIGSDGKTVAVLVNHSIVRPENRTGTILRENDRVEILFFAGGG